MELVSEEGKVLSVPKKVALLSKMIKEAVEDDDDDDQAVPCPNVKYSILSKIMDYNKYYLENKMTEIEKPLKSQNLNEIVDEWYAKFIDVEQEMLFQVILGANYLDIQPLLDLSCAKVASMIKGKSPEEIRNLFNIKNDFSAEEERQIRDENKWCDEM